MPRSLYSTFGFRKILHPINHRLEYYGLTQTMRYIVKKCSSGFNVNLPKKTKKILKNDRVLLICNHPAQMEVLLLLAAVPPRKRTFLIAMHGLLSILPSIDEHLIPVYITHRIDNKSQHDWKYRLFKKIHSIQEYSKEIAHQKNIESIALAAKKIDQNSLVGIFPAGGASDGNFLPGVGHLIKNLKYPKKTKIVMAHVDGTSSWDFLRVIPIFGKILPKFKIDFSEPLEVSVFIKKDSHSIVSNLQNIYNRWSSAFKSLPKFKTAALCLRSLFFFLFFKG